MGRDDVSEKVRIEIRNRPFLPIFVNRGGPYWFLLDTGNHSSNVSFEISQTLQLEREDVPYKEACVSIVEFAVGGIRWKHVVYPADLCRHAELLSRPLDGMLGYFFLKDLKVTINYPEETLIVEARRGLEETLYLPPQEIIRHHVQDYTDLVKERDLPPNHELFRNSMEHGEETKQRLLHEVPMQIRFGTPVIPVYIDGSGPYQFIFDTGASVCIISPELAKTLQIEPGESGTARGLRDEKEYYSSRVETLVVGAVQCSNLRVIVMDCSHVSESVKSQVDGYLGHSFLKEFEVTINYPEKTLVFQ